ncbi:MAG: thiamine biosynthesis protein ThiF [Desulfuromonas sp.]|nr:MAG: thiamine biosynthesis protein ThiF [Desulfuromonas sp.]
MKIYLNEKEITFDAGTTLHQLRDQHKPEADVTIHNGHLVRDDAELSDGDSVVLIKRGEKPSAEEMEALLLARHTPGIHQKLKPATVGIAGVGGLGSAVATALARSGVGRLIVADFDVVEPSNLNRQQFFVDQIGLPKVDALKENLKRINPYVQVATFFGRLDPDNIAQVFGRVDVLVEAFDAAEQKAMLVETFRKTFPDVPLVAASGMAGHETANSVQTRRVGSNFYLVGDEVTGAEPGRGLMAPRVGVAAHHQANAVLRLLVNEEP